MISKVDTDILKSTLLLIFYGWGEERMQSVLMKQKPRYYYDYYQ